MIVQLTPTITFENEKENKIFFECLDTVREACNGIEFCETCPWYNFCSVHFSEENMAMFIDSFKALLQEIETK